MKKSKLLCLAGILFAIIGILFFEISRDREPEYQGRSLDSWLKDLRSPSADVREKANAAFTNMQPPAWPYLVKRMQSKESPFSYFLHRWIHFGVGESPVEHRMQAARALVALGSAAKPAIPEIAKMINDPVIGLYAMDILRHTGAEGAASLVQAYTNSNISGSLSPREQARESVNRLTLAAVLGSTGTNAQSAVPALLNELQDTNFTTKLMALVALGKISSNNSNVQSAIFAQLKDPDDTVRVQAIRALVRIDKDDMRLMRQTNFNPLQIPLGNNTTNQVLFDALKSTALTDTSYRVRETATQALIKLAPKQAFADLVEKLESPDAIIRQHAARNLLSFKHGGKDAVPALLKCLNDTNRDVRFQAFIALRDIEEEPSLVLPAFIKKLYDSDAEIQAMVVRALPHFEPPATNAVPSMLKILRQTKDNTLFHETLHALKEIDSTAGTTFEKEWGEKSN